MIDDFSELDRLIEQLRGDDLSEKEQARLIELLEQSPESRKRFAQQMALSAALRNVLSDRKDPAAGHEPAISASHESSLRSEVPTSTERELRGSFSIPIRLPRRRFSTVLAAAVAGLLVAVGVWTFWRPHPTQPLSTKLAAGWRITPTGDATFRVIEPTLVGLDRGELLVESVKAGAPALRIKTPHGHATAKGTRFYIGSHSQRVPRIPAKGEETMFMSLTRILVLSGVVTLTTSTGSVEGTSGSLLGAEPDKAPTKLVVQANSDFAFDLYRQLARENAGKSLFFSPYSVSNALAMTAEGARDKTAEEIGNVLRFPKAFHRVGDDAQLIPWRTSLVHTGFANLNRQFDRDDTNADKRKAIKSKIAKLRVELKEKQATLDALRKKGRFVNDEIRQLVDAENAVVDAAANIRKLAVQIDRYELKIANALWGEKTYPFRKQFVDTITQHYDTGGVFPVDFKHNFDAERRKINSWVEDRTNQRIQNLLPQGSVSELTRLVLTNAIYFKGNWSVPFEKEKTSDRPFTLSSGDKVPARIMFAPELAVVRYGGFNADGSLFKTPARIRPGQKEGLYPGNDGFTIVELPYKGDDISMVVILPNKADGLSTVEEKLTPENLGRWIAQLKNRDTHVYLPKFKLETEYTLGDADRPSTLQKMGMTLAFVNPLHPDGADFRGMCESDDPAYRLYISKVLHKAYVEVNEEGTEAAAATAVATVVGGVPPTVPFVPEFNANHPFVFAIREKSTGSVLFLGRVMKPTTIAQTARTGSNSRP